jgi:hypothetical protein
MTSLVEKKRIAFIIKKYYSSIRQLTRRRKKRTEQINKKQLFHWFNKSNLTSRSR